MKKRVILADIAKRAGVHPTTVSMALRNHRNLPKHTIERIRKIADDMGYRPDPALTALNAYRHQKHGATWIGTLAYITNWNAEYAWRNFSAHRRFFEGAKAQADALGYNLEHFWLGDPKYSQERINKILLSRGIRGLLFASWLPQNDCELYFDWEQFCCIKIDYFPSNAPMNIVSNDQQSIILTAFQKLWDKGYRRIGLVMPKGWDVLVMHAWTIGYLAAQQRNPSHPALPILCYETEKEIGAPDQDIQIESHRLKRWIDANEPDAILSFKPYIETAFRELEITPCQDIGYADLCREPEDAHTSGVINACEQVGKAAVEALVGQINRNETGCAAIHCKTFVEGLWQEHL